MPFDLSKLENIIYMIVMVVVVILSTIKQFKAQQIKNDINNKIILNNLNKIDEQNIKVLSLLEMHSKDIKEIKKDLNALERRVSKLEENYTFYEKEVNKNDNT